MAKINVWFVLVALLLGIFIGKKHNASLLIKQNELQQEQTALVKRACQEAFSIYVQNERDKAQNKRYLEIEEIKENERRRNLPENTYLRKSK
jgi:hypothetical protein